MRINRASLYGAFGEKRALFLLALRHMTPPREMQLDWRLIRSESLSLDPAVDDRERFGFFVHFEVKPGRDQEFRNVLDPLLDTMSTETRFVNYFLLQHEQVANRFTIYETWLGTPDEFSKPKCRVLIDSNTRWRFKRYWQDLESWSGIGSYSMLRMEGAVIGWDKWG